MINRILEEAIELHGNNIEIVVRVYPDQEFEDFIIEVEHLLTLLRVDKARSKKVRDVLIGHFENNRFHNQHRDGDNSEVQLSIATDRVRIVILGTAMPPDLDKMESAVSDLHGRSFDELKDRYRMRFDELADSPTIPNSQTARLGLVCMALLSRKEQLSFERDEQNPNRYWLAMAV